MVVDMESANTEMTVLLKFSLNSNDETCEIKKFVFQIKKKRLSQHLNPGKLLQSLCSKHFTTQRHNQFIIMMLRRVM